MLASLIGFVAYRRRQRDGFAHDGSLAFRLSNNRGATL
jgi:hypothetical protein